jgi:hypothetical protein
MKTNKKQMKILPGLIIMTLLFFASHYKSDAQNQYVNSNTLSQKIDLLAKTYPSVCSVKTIEKSYGGKDIRVLTIGTGNKDNKPGMAVIGGIEGNHISGRELAMGFATSLLNKSASEEVKELLSKITFYIIPDVNPDATDQFFSHLKYERTGNNRPTDDDRDFIFDEDPYEDLNNDGYITLLRISDPAGKYTECDEDNRIMVPAEISKGQTGKYIVHTEGIDNDKDDLFNEDGAGGVNFNRNFTFNYEEFGPESGLHPVSEPESKALADFLYDRFNIYAVFSFGPQDNLGSPMEYKEQAANDRRITSILKKDAEINKLVSDMYRRITCVKGVPETAATPGNFMDWAYFHYGRYSFSTPAWWLPLEKGKNKEVELLKNTELNNVNDLFVPWTEINHPDYPGKKAEVGGIRPFALNNPPASALDTLITKNYDFIIAVASMHPELEFLDVAAENEGDGIFRITLKLHNKGIFATCAEIGENNIFTRVMRLTLTPEEGQSIISGLKVQKVSTLEGDESEEFSWLIYGKGVVKITAGATNTGFITEQIELK